MHALRRILPYLKPYWKEIILSMITLVLVVFSELMIPRQMQRVIDDGIIANDMNAVISQSLLMVGLAVLAMIFTFVNIMFSVQVAESFAADIRDLAYRQIQRFSFSNLDKLQTGELLVRLTSDINIVKNAVTMTMRMVARAPLMMVGSFVMLIITSPQLSLILVVLIPLTVGMIVWFSLHTEKMYKAVQAGLDRVNTILQENIAGVQVVKAFVRSQHENDRFADANEIYTARSITVNQLVALLLPTMMLLVNFGLAMIIWAGGLMSIEGMLTTGELIAFTNYLMFTMFPVMMLGMILPMLFASEASVERTLEIVDTEPTIVDRPDARPMTKVQGRVAFEGVSMFYDGGHDHGQGEPVLKDVTFVAEPGQTVAILGATGAGKSTLVNLIPRFYDVNAGRVTIDGTDVRDVTYQSLRSHIGVCLQEAVLFSGTIKENIRFGDREATIAQVEQAAKIADAHDFALAKADGYDTELGQRGAGLSGGQRQRISIARALATKPKILILDDSTSAVDVTTESEIQAALQNEMPGVTKIVVAQRISTVLNADKIVVLDNGRVTAQGTHAELMVSSPIYQEIYQSQLGNGNGNGAEFAPTEVDYVP